MSRSQSSEDQKDNKPSRVQDLLHNRPLLIFAASVILFYFASAPLFLLVSQKLAGGQAAPALFVSASIVVAQLTMILIATQIGNIANKWGRKPLFFVACTAVLMRALLYTFSQNPWYLVAIQVLDGVASGIASVVVVDLAKGTGRFNLIQDAINASIGIGASLGNLVLGFLVHRTDFRIGFLTSAGIALITLVLFWFAMPETNKHNNQE